MEKAITYQDLVQNSAEFSAEVILTHSSPILLVGDVQVSIQFKLLDGRSAHDKTPDKTRTFGHITSGIRNRDLRVEAVQVHTRIRLCDDEDGCLVGCSAMLSGRSLQTFQRSLLPPSSGRSPP
jgi:hypothetical protein